ncbi:MAG TPA: RNA 2',3'-cyclic phosphodiesterase [Pyrinomonadaceae bacterium]|nr:RNA 2',3'-cyclic phosphodiesterase [Pyrinomonadaceae bacterium]
MFCAFELPEALRSRINQHAQRVREAVPEAAASWSRPENIHLTVKFFGNVDRAKAPLISAAAARVVKEFSTIEIEVGKTGVFPRPSRPQVLWIGIGDPSGALLKVQQNLEDEFAVDGFPKEDRAFRPHLTIARIRNPHNASRLAQTHLELEFSSVAVTLNELVLFRSELSSNGSKYTAISTHRL